MRHWAADIRRGATDDRHILIGCVVVWAILFALLESKGLNGFQASSYAANFVLYIAALLIFIAGWVVWLLLRHRPERPIGFLAKSFAAERLSQRLARGTPMLLALTVFLPTFSAMKGAIPVFGDYVWDATWMNLDRSLHGDDPWRILQPFLGYPLITSVLSALYHLWLLLIYAGGVYFCFFQDNRELRARFFMSYFTCWLLLGVVAATAFASFGPCFVAPLLNDHTFDAQMAYLRSANEQFPVLVLPVQDRLVAEYLVGNDGLGRGISAMPSMHVSLAFLFFLAMRHVSRRAGLLFGAFFAIILIGSVHLAYHYGVDGYVSILVTGLVWTVSGPVARLSHARKAIDESSPQYIPS